MACRLLWSNPDPNSTRTIVFVYSSPHTCRLSQTSMLALWIVLPFARSTSCPLCPCMMQSPYIKTSCYPVTENISPVNNALPQEWWNWGQSPLPCLLCSQSDSNRMIMTIVRARNIELSNLGTLWTRWQSTDSAWLQRGEGVPDRRCKNRAICPFVCCSITVASMLTNRTFSFHKN